MGPLVAGDVFPERLGRSGRGQQRVVGPALTGIRRGLADDPQLDLELTDVGLNGVLGVPPQLDEGLIQRRRSLV